MIRFACPGCSSTFSVDDAKAGKSGKCPKCGAAFIIPAAEAAAPPPLPAPPPPLPPPDTVPQSSPPPADPNAPVEIDPCPKCQTKLSVAASDLGNDVECPYCKTVFASARAGTRPPAPPPAPSGRKSNANLDFEGKPKPRRDRDEVDDDDRPRRRRRDEDEEEEERPSKRRGSRRDEDDDERPSRRGKPPVSRRDDDEDDDRPSRRRGSRRDDDDDDDDYDDRPRRRRSRRRSGGSGERSGAVTAASVMTIIVGVMWLLLAGMIFFGFTTALGVLGGVPRGGFNPGRAQAENILLGATLCCGIPTVLMSVLHILGGVFALQRKGVGRILVIICSSIGILGGLYLLYVTMRVFFFFPVTPPFDAVLMLLFGLLSTLGYGIFAMIVMCRSDYADEFD